MGSRRPRRGRSGGKDIKGQVWERKQHGRKEIILHMS